MVWQACFLFADWSPTDWGTVIGTVVLVGTTIGVATWNIARALPPKKAKADEEGSEDNRPAMPTWPEVNEMFNKLWTESREQLAGARREYAAALVECERACTERCAAKDRASESVVTLQRELFERLLSYGESLRKKD